MQTAIIGEADILCTKDSDFFEDPAREYLSKLGIVAVSYTHLDVYKRQGRYHGIICGSIADGGRLVGHFGDQERACRGFVRDEHGALTEFDAPCEGNSVAITSVSPLVAGATDSITIKGRHFGSYRPPTDPRERYIVIKASAPDRLCLDDLADDMTRGNVREGALRAVSYTHLDVYKRQAERRGMATMASHRISLTLDRRSG